MTMNGNRLFACEHLDGGDCGKGDYKSIAKAFCGENEGFAEADNIDVDSKKVKAETLDGRSLQQEQVQGVRADHLHNVSNLAERAGASTARV